MNTHIELLEHADHNVRGRAALTLRTLGDVGAVDALIRALRTEPNLFVRENITAALVRLGDATLSPLIHLLGDTSPAVRHDAAHALSKIGDARAVDALIDTLQDHDVTVVTKAAFALGRIGDARAIPALVGLLGHESREMQSTLASVLERFGRPAVPPLLDRLEDERWQAREHAAYILGSSGAGTLSLRSPGPCSISIGRCASRACMRWAISAGRARSTPCSRCTATPITGCEVLRQGC